MPRDFKNLAERCVCNNSILKGTKLRAGAYGSVYHVVRSGNTRYALKIQKNNAYAKAEINAYMQLANLKVTPIMYAAWTCKGKAYIILEKLYACKRDNLPRVQKLISRMLTRGWLHADVHTGNIMCTKQGRVILIDFGWAVKKSEYPYANHANRTFEQLKANQDLQLRSL